MKATVAVLQRLGRGSQYVRGHRETSTSGKIDPSFIDLDVLRARITTRLGEATDTAVRAFQTKKGLAVDGSVGPVTWVALMALIG